MNCGAIQKSGGNTWAVLAAIPVFFLAIFCLIIPLCNTLLLSFEHYRPTLGILGSPWVGFQNYTEFLSSEYFLRLLSNSAIQGFLCLIAGGVAVFALTALITLIPNKWIRCGALSIILLPAILPFHFFLSLLPKEFMTSPGLYRLVPVLNEIFCIAPLAVLAGSFLLTKKLEWKRVTFITLTYVGLRLTLFLFPDLQMQLATYTPSVYESADVFGTYQYRTGFANSDYGISSAATILQSVLNIIPWLIGGFILITLTNKMNNFYSQKTTLMKSSTNVFSALIIAGGAFVMILFSVILTLFAMIFMNLEHQVIGSVILSIASCLTAAIFAIGLAYPIITGNKITSIITLIVTICLLPLCSNLMGQYLYHHNLGAANTLFGVMFQNATWGIFGAFGLVIAVGGHNNASGKEIFRRILPPCIAFLCIGFCKFYASYYLYPMLFLRSRTLYPVAMILRELSAGMTEATLRSMAFVTGAYLLTAIIGLGGIWTGSALISKDIEKSE